MISESVSPDAKFAVVVFTQSFGGDDDPITVVHVRPGQMDFDESDGPAKMLILRGICDVTVRWEAPHQLHVTRPVDKVILETTARTLVEPSGALIMIRVDYDDAG